MGYTHYWYIREENLEALPQVIASVASDLKRLLPVLPPLAGPDGTGEPILGPREVGFNGPRSRGEDYESLWLTPDLGDYTKTQWGLFSACKTARRPYDLAVMVALLLLKFHAEFFGVEVQVDSDGNILDWAGASRLVESLGYPIDLLWALGRRVWRVRSPAGVFYVEWPEDEDPEEGVEWLERMYKLGFVPEPPPFRLEPYDGYPPGKPTEEGSPIYRVR